MNTETEKEFQMATHCHICEQAFTYKTKKVRDHYHVGVEGDANFPNYSNFRGAACNGCNINFRAISGDLMDTSFVNVLEN